MVVSGVTDEVCDRMTLFLLLIVYSASMDKEDINDYIQRSMHYGRSAQDKLTITSTEYIFFQLGHRKVNKGRQGICGGLKNVTDSFDEYVSMLSSSRVMLYYEGHKDRHSKKIT